MKHFLVVFLALLTLSTPAAADVNVHGQLKNAQLEKRSSDPTGKAAQVYYNTTDNVAKYYNGTAWKTIMDTTAALTSPVVSNYVDYSEIATPSSPSSGKLRVYSKSDDKLYTLTSAGIEQAVGSGTGSGGGTNYDTNPSGASNTAGYTPTGTMTVTRVTSGLPRANTTGTGLSLAAGSAGDYVQYCFDIDSVDTSKKLGFLWAQVPSVTPVAYVAGDMKAEAYSFTSANCGGTATALQIDQGGSNKYYSIPNVTDVIPLTFDTTTATHYGIRYTRVTGTSSNVVSNVTVTPDKNTVVGIAVEAAQPYTATFTGAGTVTQSLYYQRIVNKLHVTGYFSTGTPDATTFSISLPSGLHLDPAQLQGINVTRVGTVESMTKTTQADMVFGQQLSAFTDTNTSTTVIYATEQSGSNILAKRSGNGLFASSQNVSVDFEVPIAEWAGSGVNIGNNSPDCASNSGTWDSTDTTSFANGTAGSTISSDLSSARRKRVRFLAPIQPTDLLVLKLLHPDTATWIPMIGATRTASTADRPIVSLTRIDSVLYGAGYYLASGYAATDVDVYFGQYINPNYSALGGAGDGWSVFTNAKWMLCKYSGAALTGFAAATSTSMGLITADASTISVPWTTSKPFTSAQTSIVHAYKVGKIATLVFPVMNAACSSTNTADAPIGTIPAGYLPALTTFATVIGIDNSATSGKVFYGFIHTNGSFEIGPASGTYTASGTCGWQSFSITYGLN
jgi:hypothetical protein